MTSRPTFARMLFYMLGFELLTVPVGIWGWKSGLSFWSIMPFVVFCGMIGGAFLSTGVYAIKTGYMQRMSSFYRFSDRPVMFITDFMMLLLAIIMAFSAPFSYSMQKLSKLNPNREQGPEVK